MNSARILMFGLLASGAVLAQADTLVNTFGASGIGYFASVGWNLDANQSLGKSFSLGSSYTLSEIKIALRMGDESDQMLVSLRADSGGQPDATLESFTVSTNF